MAKWKRKFKADMRPRVAISMPLPGDVGACLMVKYPVEAENIAKLRKYLDFMEEALTWVEDDQAAEDSDN